MFDLCLFLIYRSTSMWSQTAVKVCCWTWWPLYRQRQTLSDLRDQDHHSQLAQCLSQTPYQSYTGCLGFVIVLLLAFWKLFVFYKEETHNDYVILHKPFLMLIPEQEHGLDSKCKHNNSYNGLGGTKTELPYPFYNFTDRRRAYNTWYLEELLELIEVRWFTPPRKKTHHILIWKLPLGFDYRMYIWELLQRISG